LILPYFFSIPLTETELRVWPPVVISQFWWLNIFFISLRSHDQFAALEALKYRYFGAEWTKFIEKIQILAFNMTIFQKI
jgi:hypothetical protein